jgi:hypothetical protein
MTSENHSNRISRRKTLKTMSVATVGITGMSTSGSADSGGDESLDSEIADISIVNNCDEQRRFEISLVDERGTVVWQSDEAVSGFTDPANQSPEDVIRHLSLDVVGDGGEYTVNVRTGSLEDECSVVVGEDGLGREERISVRLSPCGVNELTAEYVIA